MLEFISFAILVIGLANLIRLAIFMIAADVYDVENYKKFKNKQQLRIPLISILIPAFNEQDCIEKTIRSVVSAKYRKKEIVVIDDGSTDDTVAVVNKVIKRYPRSKITLISQANGGKGSALNKGIANSSGELVMVLDADSTIDKNALTNAVKYFKDKRVKAVAASVSLQDNGTWLGFIQRVEYLLSYRMKRSLTVLNIEYIIGGVGSIYRRSTLKQVSGYRTNTITEDIDLSMKVIARGNKAYRVVFASDVRTCTQPVQTLKELISQRTRWKQGRLQAFIRYRHIFASNNKKYSRLLSWFQLPYAIFGEIYLMLEPLFVGVIIAIAIKYGDPRSMIMALGIMCAFLMFNFMASTDETPASKLALIILTPITYFLLPILAYVELVSLFRTIKSRKKLQPHTVSTGSWTHVKRASV